MTEAKKKAPTMVELMAARHQAEKEGRVRDAAVLRGKIMARLDNAKKRPGER